MTSPGPLPQPLNKVEKPVFKLGLHLSPQSHKVATRLPKHTAINDLWDLDINNLGNEITQCISMLFSHVVERGEPREEVDTFHHSTAATALWEAYHGKKIKGKNHALKAGGLFNKVRNLLSSIKHALKKEPIDENQKEILLNFQAILIGHHNNLVVALQKQPQTKKNHLEKNANIKVDELKKINLTTAQQTRIFTVLPASPVKTTREQSLRVTPKKRSHADKLSILALQSDRPLTEEDFDNFLSTNAETTNHASTVRIGIAPPLIPRQIIMNAKTARHVLGTHKRLLFADDIKETIDSKDLPTTISVGIETSKDLGEISYPKPLPISDESAELEKFIAISKVSDDAEATLLETVQPTVLTGYESYKDQQQKLFDSPTKLSIPDNTQNIESQSASAKPKLGKNIS